MSAYARARKALREAKNLLWLAQYRRFKSGRILKFSGHLYDYLYVRYNASFANERAVEVPIAWEVVQQYDSDRVLEIGNVLSHYFPISHDILDKYERAARVINQDVVDFQPAKHYDLIVSISTLEHVGWDEHPRDPDKFLLAIDHLRTLLTPQGKILMTLPLGYNQQVDRFLQEGRIPFTAVRFLKRVSADNLWREADWQEVEGSEYLTPGRTPLHRVAVQTATAIVVGEVAP